MQRWLAVLAVTVQCVVLRVGCVNPAPDNCLNYESTYHIVRGCDCVVYQSYGLNDGQFISPNFPEFYPPNTNCILYSFFGDAFEIIELTFLEFDLRMPASNGNCTDFVRIFQNLERPEVNENSPYDVELCGNYSGLRRKKFYSSHRSLILEFHTDSPTGQNRQYKGFRGIYRFLDKRNFVTNGSASRRTTVHIRVPQQRHPQTG
ncbi:uncharacterized protein LOC112566221 [Pomacea canaliculata]|uniref:uncharacterized protein LOC112566221 n=1 Tax=Pomacea canaliculata TaxID=400727 RepID=UPI000D725EE1|nr:uncharacterized protein LOC112566221 [Pomacea canaliculata]